MISYDEDLLEAHYEAAEDNRFMDYADFSKHYSEGIGLTDYEIFKVRKSIEEHRRELRKELSELTGISEEEIDQSVESADIGSELELENIE